MATTRNTKSDTNIDDADVDVTESESGAVELTESTASQLPHHNFFTRLYTGTGAFDIVGKLRSLHCSIGVAEAPRDGEHGSALLSAALGAADRAQVQGGGRYAVAGDPRLLV